MARKIIDTGIVGNDGTGDSIRDSFRKVNDNFRELYSSLGLGERLTFTGLNDTPDSYVGQNDIVTGATPVVTVSDDESGLAFKQIKAGSGISINFTRPTDPNPNEIVINAEFSRISADPEPALGGNLSVRSGGNQYRIRDLVTPINPDEPATKTYADTKVSRAGVNTIDPATGQVNAALGRMSGPLILSRSPEPEDDLVYDGLIAATKSYVDNSSFGSVANLYVATSGADDRVGVSKALQGRALAYAYRTVEAAFKRAEELVLEARVELGPYKKTLTYNNGEYECYLNAVQTSPISGTGFVGSALMSVDAVTLNSGGSNYNAGDILTLDLGLTGTIGPGGQRATIEVLTTLTTPGKIVTFRIVSTGAYTQVPGSVGVATDPDLSVTEFGAGATFDVTYKVNNVFIDPANIALQSGYSLVSVRITGGGGAGAFGTAEVVGGKIIAITVTDQGSGFTSVPVVEADLPRFLLFTNGLRTDSTGDVTSTNPAAARSRDIREGLYLRGEDSGALAQILAHDGSLDGDDEIFDVDIKYGVFQIGETIAFGDITKNVQITVLVESGVYEENYPLKLPQNTSIVGDEFRRCIIRPKKGTSSSPWAFGKFRRDLTLDGLQTANQLYGYHYLQDTATPVYDKIQNPGFFRSASALLDLNRVFLQEEVAAWINVQVAAGTPPFATTFSYNKNLWKRDIGLIIDSIAFDLKYGGYNRTISSGLKYFSGERFEQGKLFELIATFEYINILAQQIIDNTAIPTVYNDLYNQTIDNAYIAETSTDLVINDLILALIDVVDSSGSVNYPKENDQMDVFLANDAVRWQAITAQGHGGFMGVLDPEGQILAKSPYFQECASFSKSINAQTFAGGMFVDGFAGNLEIQITEVINPIRLRIGGLDRIPNLPCSFIVQDVVYRVNYVRDFIYDKDGSTATLVLDETTPWPFPLFVYDQATCSRDVGLILDGVGYDIVLGTNYHARKAGLAYRQANASVVILDQKRITLQAIDYAHSLAKAALVGYANQQADVDNSNEIILDIVERGPLYAPILSFTEPAGLATELSNAKTLLINNITFIKDEVIGYLSTTYPTLDYDPTKCARDVQYILEGLIYDLIYGGNSQTRDAGLKYYSSFIAGGPLQIPIGTLEETIEGINVAKELAKQVIINDTSGARYSQTPQITGVASNPTTQGVIEGLMADVVDIIENGIGEANALILPDLEAYPYAANDITARNILLVDTDIGGDTAKERIQASVIDYVNENGNKYELLMSGNRSLLCNDFTQVNDLGYGIFATNGGLVESVSMFTYYNHISYYSLNGAQIRSVGGSSAHGNYALVAEGSDPLEVPTPTGLYFDLSQRVVAYAPSAAYFTAAGDLFMYVTGYQYTPLGNSELEIDHDGIIFRYPVTSVVIFETLPGVVRLNLTSDTTGNFDGLYDQVLDGVGMTLRLNSTVILYGDLVTVSVRPSTGLRLRESPEIYRVLQFDDYEDPNGPYEISVIAGDPGRFEVRATITSIASNVCTLSQNHSLVVGDRIVARTTANNFIAGATYYVIDVPNYNQFVVSQTPTGVAFTLTNTGSTTIKVAKTHHFLENFYLTFSTTDTLPDPLLAGVRYYVAAEGLSQTEFRITTQKNGIAIEITDTGVGVHSYAPDGLTQTILRENYNFVDFTVYQPGEYAATPIACSITSGLATVINASGHGLSIGDVIRFESTGVLPIGMTEAQNYHIVDNDFSPSSFKISDIPGGTPLPSSGSATGTQTVGLVTGRAGDTSFAVVSVSPGDSARASGTRFVFKGEEYVITTFESENETNEPYGRINLNRPLADSIIAFPATYTVKAGVAASTIESTGSLTIRISLTRVTSHDILEIGTGSYADTNYPNEIYGPAVNAINATNETVERDVGRVFYVTTDQFGNFSVGPYFRVDQGTGRVTFSAAIALSNLDGIGFKRGVPIAEFSVDSTFSDNATDTVPTENATRIYIERRLGLSHLGEPINADQLIPLSGGFLSLDGQLSMKANMNLDGNRIINVFDPEDNLDAVNLRSLVWDNFQDADFNNINAADILTFTGANNIVTNSRVVGDLSFSLDSTLNTVDAQINPEVIINADINTLAGIDQFKLSLDNTYATTATSITGATGTRTTTTVILTYTLQTVAPFVAGQKIVVTGFSTALYNGTFTVLSCNSTTVTYNITLGTNAYAASQSSWVLPVTPAVGTGTIVPQKGIASFDSANFIVNNGWVGIKDNGVALGEIAQIAVNTVLGRNDVGNANVAAIAFSSVVDLGLAVKKSNYGQNGASTGYLRRIAAGTGDSAFTTVESSTGATGYISSDASKLIERNSSGDFGANVADLKQLKIDGQLALDTGPVLITTTGFIKLYGYNSLGGITLQTSTVPAENVNFYDNDSHVFRPASGIGNAPIVASSVQTLTLTTGGNTTLGNITGRWSLTGTSPTESRLQATYSADLAEYYEGDQEYPVGTVLIFGGDKEVTISNKQADHRIAGVVSNTAAFVMYDACPGHKNLVALQGRVPCRVVGKIEKGDLLVTSNIPGVAVSAGSAAGAGTIVGKAFNEYDSSHIGTIEIAVGRT